MVTVPCHHPLASRLPALPLSLHPNPLLTTSPSRRRRPPPFARRRRPPTPLRVDAVVSPDSSSSSFSNPDQQQLKTVFPGGFKRPEIRVPTLALQVSVAELLDAEGSAQEIDVALSRGAGMVVLDTGGESGARLYEAACSLKSLVGDRAYFLIAERVDIAAAVGASGVVLSDDAIPTLIARKMMMKAESDSVYLPLVARIVQNTNSAVIASSSEGADFLIMTTSTDNSSDTLVNSLIQHVKVPIFFTLINSLGNSSWSVASKLLETGACGIVMSSKDTKHLSDDIIRNMFVKDYLANRFMQDEYHDFPKTKIDDSEVMIEGENGFSGFTKLDERVVQLIEAEKLLIHEVVACIQKAAPMMKEVSLLVDAASRLSEPFLLVIVGEFNSGKSTVINALLGRKYLKEGVIPTTNEITLLSYSDVESDYQNRCERNPDGQFICYLSAPILREMNLVDTPGTNVILQRQQRLTEEFVPRADLILFVISADRPLSESEVDFLRYVQQWKKKVVFVLNKLDLYRNASELQEAIEFVRGNAVKLLSTEEIKLFPVSARSALEAKLSTSLYDASKYEELLLNDPRWLSSRFYELEDFLFSFLDGSTETGMERVRLKLESPLGIVDRLLSSCERFVKQRYQSANQDLISIMKVRSSVNDYASRIENESLSWRKQASSLIATAKTRAVKLMESILQLSNTDLISIYAFRGEKSGSIVTISAVQNEIIGPAISDAQELLREFLAWLESTNTREGELYKEQFEKEWQELLGMEHALQPHTYKLLGGEGENLSLKVMENFKASAAAKLFEQEIREVALGTFGGLGAAGLSASLLTSVLPTTLEDLLALALCSAGGFIAISSFPARRKEAIAKLQKVADTLANEIEDAMKKDLLISIEKLDRFVQAVSDPYIEAAQNRIDQLEKIQAELEHVEQKFKALKFEIQNVHLS